MLNEKPYQVAIVDDDPSVLLTVEKVLKKNPVLTALKFTNPEEAFEAIKSSNIRIVFADLNMPRLAGDELLRKCIALERGIQFVIISGESSLAMADSCLSLGAKDVLLKPVIPRDVDLVIKECTFFLEKWNGIINDRKRYQRSA